MSLRKLCNTRDQVTGNIASKVVFKFEWTCIGAIKCLELTFAKSAEDLSISTCYEKIVNVCAKEDVMVIDCDFPHPLPFHTLHVDGKSSWQCATHKLLMAFLTRDTRREDLPIARWDRYVHTAIVTVTW